MVLYQYLASSTVIVTKGTPGSEASKLYLQGENG